MKKVLFITTVSGFLYQFEMSNVKLLQEMGYEVHYAANARTPGYKIDESLKKRSDVIFHHVNISKSPKDLLTNIKAKCELVRLVKELGIKLIHCHTPVGGMLGRLVGNACRDEGVKVIYTTHGFHFYDGAPAHYKLFQFTEKKLAQYTDAIITINKEDYRNARRFRLRQGGKVYHIPGEGTDTDRYSDERKTAFRGLMRERLGIKEDEFFILSVGELSANKNHETLLDAVGKLKNKKIKYGICGDGTQRVVLRKKIIKEGLKDKVSLYGYQQDVEKFLYAADAFVFPSVREGLGMAAIEALASGLPVIAADNRGTKEYMTDGKNGYICSPYDVAGFVRNIEKVRNMSQEKRREMELFCRESAKKFDIKNVRPIMKKIYKEMDVRLWGSQSV